MLTTALFVAVVLGAGVLLLWGSKAVSGDLLGVVLAIAFVAAIAAGGVVTIVWDLAGVWD